MTAIRIDIISIFPGYFREAFDYGIIRRALAAQLVEIKAHDLRSWTSDKHKVVDDRPFGGGDGMVLKPEPIFAGVEALTGATRREELPPRTRVVLLSAQGQVLTQALAQDLSQDDLQLVLLCGRYEGVDERVADALVTDEISIGDYVLSGGELAAMVIVDAVARQVPGVVGDARSVDEDSFADRRLDHPHYTRPAEFEGWRVPDVLLSGHHAEIARWRLRESLRRTLDR